MGRVRSSGPDVLRPWNEPSHFLSYNRYHVRSIRGLRSPPTSGSFVLSTSEGTDVMRGLATSSLEVLRPLLPSDIVRQSTSEYLQTGRQSPLVEAPVRLRSRTWLLRVVGGTAALGSRGKEEKVLRIAIDQPALGPQPESPKVEPLFSLETVEDSGIMIR